MKRFARLAISGLALAALSAPLWAAELPASSLPVLGGDALQKVAMEAARSQPPAVKDAVSALAKAGFFKGPMLDGLKVSLAGSNVVFGDLDQELLVKVATQFASAKYGARIKFQSVKAHDDLKVVFFLRPGSGDLNPTLIIGVAIDAQGKTVKDIAAQDEEQVMDFLFPSHSGVW